jgi:Flp pilus assembly pilin Flp
MNFLRDERGQDVSEYALLLSFLLLAFCALTLGHARTMHGVWSTANTIIQWAGRAAIS